MSDFFGKQSHFEKKLLGLVVFLALLFQVISMVGGILLTIFHSTDTDDSYASGFTYVEVMIWIVPFAVNLKYTINYKSNSQWLKEQPEEEA